MDQNTTNDTSLSRLNLDTVFGLLIFGLGVFILFIAYLFKSWESISPWGFTLISIGTPLILWRVFMSITNLKLFRIMQLMGKENLIEIIKGGKRGKELITKTMFEWAQSKDACTLKISGIAMIHIFGNDGILNELIDEKKIINSDIKRIQISLLNPFSINAITKSIQQKRPFNIDSDPISAITEHTLDQHKMCNLYDEFTQVTRNIRDLQNNSRNYKLPIECKIYNSTPPNFLMINDHRAIIESLVHVKKDNIHRLKGLLPHLVYGKGETRDDLNKYFDYIWQYDSVTIDDFHEEVEEKYYEINRLILLYSLQKEIWEKQWAGKHARSKNSTFDNLYQSYKEFFPGIFPKAILDLGCGDGGGGSLTILEEHVNTKIDFVDISRNAIELLKVNIQDREIENPKLACTASDMLTYLIQCEMLKYSLVHANFSIIYMTKLRAVEIYRRIFNILDHGGVFMLSVWTINYFKMPISQHGKDGHRPPHIFTAVPMAEDLQILTGGSVERLGEIRRFYRGFEELLEELQSADENNVMDLENIIYRSYENDAILRVWVQKKP